MELREPFLIIIFWLYTSKHELLIDRRNRESEVGGEKTEVGLRERRKAGHDNSLQPKPTTRHDHRISYKASIEAGTVSYTHLTLPTN